MMKKVIIAVLVFIAVFISANIILVNDSEIVVQTDIYLADGDKESLEQHVNAYTEVKFTGINTIFSKSVSCKIKAPDVASYIRNNKEKLSEMYNEMFYYHIVEALKCDDMGIMTVTIDIPVNRDGLRLMADPDNSDAYLDAVSGGLYSLYDELLMEAITEMEASK